MIRHPTGHSTRYLIGYLIGYSTCPLTGYLICPTAHSAHSRRMALNRSPYSSAIRP